MHSAVGTKQITKTFLERLLATYDDIQHVVADAIGEQPEQVDILRSVLNDDDRVVNDVIIEIFVDDPFERWEELALAEKIVAGLAEKLPYATYKIRPILERAATARYTPRNVMQ